MKNNVNFESMKHHSMVVCQEYGIPYDDAWTYIEEIAKKHDLSLEYNVNVIWCTLEAEKELKIKYGMPYYWKYQD